MDEHDLAYILTIDDWTDVRITRWMRIGSDVYDITAGLPLDIERGLSDAVIDVLDSFEPVPR